MNIVLPIISNVIVALVLLLGVFTGLKQEWKLSLVKLLLICGIGVASYFLITPVTNLLVSIPALSNIGFSDITFRACSFSAMFLIASLVVEVVMLLIARCRDKKRRKIMSNGIIVKRAKALDKRAEKSLRKEDRRNKRLERKNFRKAHKKARLFGAVLSVLAYVLIAFALFIPVKYVAKDVATAHPNYAVVETAYTHTAFGQLDALTNVVEYIVK